MSPRPILATLLCLLFSAILLAQNKNPFESIGKKGKILTLSKGKYEELFDQDSIQQVGTALVNVRQMKVVKLLENEDEAKRLLDNSSTSRFLSIDPLSYSYPMLTPYQFASNKPIAAIDLDGAESFMKIIQYDKTGKATAVDLVYDETLAKLNGAKIYVQHSYPSGAVMKYEELGPLDFSQKKYGYANARGNKDFSISDEDNPFYNSPKDKSTTLAGEFFAGIGPENTIIKGGKMISSIKKMESFQALYNDALKSFKADGKIEPGESFSGYHKMTYSEGAEDIWIPTAMNGSLKAGAQFFFTTQHFLGSYSLRIDVLEDGKTALFTIADSKSFESITDHQNKGNSTNRQDGKVIPYGSTYQRYIWIAPLASNEESSSKPATNEKK